jgi:hypothetical protein
VRKDTPSVFSLKKAKILRFFFKRSRKNRKILWKSKILWQKTVFMSEKVGIPLEKKIHSFQN